MKIFVNFILIILLFLFTACANVPEKTVAISSAGNEEAMENKEIEMCKGRIINNSIFHIHLLFTPIDDEGKTADRARYFVFVKDMAMIDVDIMKDNYIVTSQPQDPNTKGVGDIRENRLLLKNKDKCTFSIRILIRDNRDEYDKGKKKKVCIMIKERCYD
jgi:hypothetical protein